MILVAGGDSFVHGNELQDWNIASTRDSQLTFTALLAAWHGMDYVCCARPGNANDAILRMTVNKCQQLMTEKKDLAVVVAWTFPPRFEFPFSYDVNSPDSPFASISIYPDTNRPMVQEFSKFFIKHVDVQWFQHYTTVKNILLLQWYLKSNHIPFIFTATDNIVFAYKNDPQLQCWWNMIEFDNWFLFPQAVESHNTTSPRGFYQWAIENKYPIGPFQHPLEQAHFDAATLLKERFYELVKKNLQ